MIREMLYKISSEFTPALNEPYVGHPLANYIRVTAPKILKSNREFHFLLFPLLFSLHRTIDNL